jgi:hypothetical protein
MALYLWLTDQFQRWLLYIDQFLEESCPLNLAIFGDFTVFLIFFGNVCSCCIETLYMALYVWLTDQVRRWLLSTNFWKNDYPLNLAILRDFTVFWIFFRNVCSYCIETFYMALYQCLTDQVRRWLLSTNFALEPLLAHICIIILIIAMLITFIQLKINAPDISLMYTCCENDLSVL